METASLPMLNSLRFCGGATRTPPNGAGKLYCHVYSNHLSTNSSLLLCPKQCCYSNVGRKITKQLGFDRFICNSSSGSISESNPSQKFAVFLEIEGVLIDVYRLGNRQAFNTAFRKLGLDCANWSQPVYLDLVRKSVGDEERMVILYFNRIGWPTSVATSEQGSFMKNVIREKKKALDDLVMSQAIPLRPGIEDFIDEASKEGVPVVSLTSYSTSGEKAARSVVEQLGSTRMSNVKMIGEEEVKQSFYGQLVFGEGVSSSLDEQLAKAANKAVSAERQRVAEEVASILKLKVELNASSSESLQKIVGALRAGAEHAEVSIDNCVLIAGSQPGVAAAERIGMPCVVIRSSSTARAEFPSAIGVFDGFGGADLTISKLRKKLYRS